MLSRSRALSARLALRPALVRNMCAPVVPLIDEVKADIEVMKEKAAAKAFSGYTPDAYKAASAAGTVDPSMLSATFDFSDEARKMVMKLHQQSMAMKQSMASETAAADFSQFEGQLPASLLAEVKGAYEAEMAKVEASTAELAEVSSLKSDLETMMSGAGGLLELAAAEEKTAEATIDQCLVDMEKVAVDIDGVAQVTIGEILDREPELRAEIEEEIKNNVWAP